MDAHSTIPTAHGARQTVPAGGARCDCSRHSQVAIHKWPPATAAAIRLIAHSTRHAPLYTCKWTNSMTKPVAGQQRQVAAGRAAGGRWQRCGRSRSPASAQPLRPVPAAVLGPHPRGHHQPAAVSPKYSNSLGAMLGLSSCLALQYNQRRTAQCRGRQQHAGRANMLAGCGPGYAHCTASARTLMGRQRLADRPAAGWQACRQACMQAGRRAGFRLTWQTGHRWPVRRLPRCRPAPRPAQSRSLRAAHACTHLDIHVTRFAQRAGRSAKAEASTQQHQPRASSLQPGKAAKPPGRQPASQPANSPPHLRCRSHCWNSLAPPRRIRHRRRRPLLPSRSPLPGHRAREPRTAFAS